LPQESTTGALATESSAHSPQSSKHCALWIYSWRSDSQDFYHGSQTSVECDMKKLTQNVYCGKQAPHHNNVPAHTALSDNFWQNIQFLPFKSPPL
jgi:hypothetical protein